MTGRDEVHPLYLALFLIGGLCTGTGILNLYYSFGYVGGDENLNISHLGFSGIDNLSFLRPADYSIPLVLVGVACLVIANASAWKETDGY
jgi:hypothetical protein